MLRFSNFEKSYDGIRALTIEDLFLDPGIYWIKGINGSGKSTLLKSIAGILSFKGDILLNNQISIKKNPIDYRKLVNFGEAEPVFPEFLTGQELIDLFSAAKNALPGQDQFLIESMGIQEHIHQPVRTLSSGILKRLSLVLAFLGSPALILLDEPLITVDERTLTVLFELIKNQNRNYGVSFLMTSHQELNATELQMAKVLLVREQTVRFTE